MGIELKSTEEFFAAFRDLVERIEVKGGTAAAKELKEGFASLNGLTDGWALLMESIQDTIKTHRAQIQEPELSDLKTLLKGVKKAVYRR